MGAQQRLTLHVQLILDAKSPDKTRKTTYRGGTEVSRPTRARSPTPCRVRFSLALAL